jgi:hypothetical protein
MRFGRGYFGRSPFTKDRQDIPPAPLSPVTSIRASAQTTMGMSIAPTPLAGITITASSWSMSINGVD